VKDEHSIPLTWACVLVDAAIWAGVVWLLVKYL
jgi:hypothetical protein